MRTGISTVFFLCLQEVDDALGIELNRIYNMDCREGLKLLEDNSIDSIVTDPPYELGFMGKGWDKTGIAYNVELWRECLRVLKPGGHLLAFGGSRTYHRMACAIEDAGFEIRDQIQWIYGSGFPKSLDISKAIDKATGAEREVVGIAKSGKTAGMQNLGPSGIKGGEYNITQPASEAARQWQGWGTALKPANEPICVARKPLSEKNVALNVLKWGTGGINIDGSRIGTREKNQSMGAKKTKNVYGEIDLPKIENKYPKILGRFPANVIFDKETAKMLDEQSGILKSGNNCVRRKEGHCLEHGGLGKSGDVQTTYGDSGGVSRFFYCAKASKSERGEFNNHPTVKPLKLIEYLIKLVTPPNGICLDPFEGSGTHALACINLGFNYIGFELNKDYFNIAINRINNIRQLSLIE
jgi:site-specific DNA-methyltransferase (adenine-specific)